MRHVSAERFGVSAASAIRWCQRQNETDSPATFKHGGDRWSGRIDAHKSLILSLVEETCGIVLKELQVRLAERGHLFSIGPLWRILDRHEITWKKTVMERREAWFDSQLDLDPEKLVFIDETWATTSMARKNGRAPKGERLRASVPHGHWKSTTFVAGAYRGPPRQWSSTARSTAPGSRHMSISFWSRRSCQAMLVLPLKGETGRYLQPDALALAMNSRPSRGLFRLVEFKPTDVDSGVELGHQHAAQKDSPEEIKECDFYQSFAEFLMASDEATKAIALGGKIFRDKWMTPDVIGIYESRKTDMFKAPTEIISAEIKSDTTQITTAFGQACAYRLFSHRCYLVVPASTDEEDLDRLDSLCQIFGLGLVTFNEQSKEEPDFQVEVRPSRHEPDLFYANKYMPSIEEKLWG